MVELICKILHIGKTTYYRYLKENYPIIKFLNSFSKSELEDLLETGTIYKINFANEFFTKLNNEFITYIIKNEGSKALMTTIFNETNINESNLNELVIKQYDNRLISNTDLSEFIKDPLSKELLLYILDNKKEEWKPFLASLDDENNWLIDYFTILKLSIEKNIYDLIFSNENHRIYTRALPKVPTKIINKPKFSKKRTTQPLIDSYKEVLTNVKQSIIDDSYNSLQVYDYFEEYHLDIKPSNKNENIPSLYEYEASQK
jgi:hypothetical protein